MTKVVYVLLVIAFVSVVSALVYYNRKVKARQLQQLRSGEEFHDTPSRIHAAMESLEREAHSRH